MLKMQRAAAIPEVDPPAHSGKDIFVGKQPEDIIMTDIPFNPQQIAHGVIEKVPGLEEGEIAASATGTQTVTSPTPSSIKSKPLKMCSVKRKVTFQNLEQLMSLLL